MPKVRLAHTFEPPNSAVYPPSVHRLPQEMGLSLTNPLDTINDNLSGLVVIPSPLGPFMMTSMCESLSLNPGT